MFFCSVCIQFVETESLALEHTADSAAAHRKSISARELIAASGIANALVSAATIESSTQFDANSTAFHTANPQSSPANAAEYATTCSGRHFVGSSCKVLPLIGFAS